MKSTTTQLERKKKNILTINKNENWYTQTIWDWRNVVYQDPKKMTLGSKESKERQEKPQRDKKIKKENRIIRE